MHRHRRDRPQPRRCVRDLILEIVINRDNPAHVLHRDREVSPTGCWPDTVARGTGPRERFVAPAAWRGTGPRPTVARHRLLSRSARACPSRTFDGPGHGGGQAPALRWDGTIFYPVGRGPVPREFSSVRSLAGDRPPPYGGPETSSICARQGLRATPHPSQPGVHEVLGESPPRSPSVPLASRRAARQRRLLHQPHLRQR